ncbi:YeeE/YedE family protein [Loktanella sp. TSTF-M6]|uniref:YeeE/YedE family protein n=1 Tax=Loktanella gaetbuli TaxID=2881335 RepID=A0ABS8BQE1_9RHOB|nr:YeeE/YedE thiosulfate transporter family protein [Loktanella gaetbuli]MCB5197938.1 YeeE/YedE family protein [Loktanella gaetbuli]
MLPFVTTAFTPFASLFGGVLIGLSAVMVMGLFGRIAGITGITAGGISVVDPTQATARDWSWRLAFLVGLIAAPLLVTAVAVEVPHSVPTNLWGMAAAGLIVGTGTALGSGCTSGHGVCGLARLSKRSAVAVLTFMAFAFVTVFIIRHVWG